ncbi:centromere protein N isoform X1 [Syngnathus typhle]|uniref:centromere protein N isoform X1 n=1 Tax=Syngnathus typhle TaxID=161592 RepID=UPI002A69E1B6|nr:centromere protein N isoform X1 [Syngnathus typhle]
MENLMKHSLSQLVRRIPTKVLKVTLEKWGRLTSVQLQNIDFTLSKWALTDELITLCEENGCNVRHIAELEMIYVIDNPNQGMWCAFQLMDPESDAAAVELMQFKEQFKCHLSELVRNVSIKMKKNTDEAVWIRIAWEDNFSRPNNMRPTYVVHYLQTPYVFVTRLTSKQKPLLSQALIIATRHQSIKDANLSGRKLSAIRDLLMRQYEQVFPTMYPSPLVEKNQIASHPHIEKEQAKTEINRRQMACEAFGGGRWRQSTKAQQTRGLQNERHRLSASSSFQAQICWSHSGTALLQELFPLLYQFCFHPSPEKEGIVLSSQTKSLDNLLTDIFYTFYYFYFVIIPKF